MFKGENLKKIIGEINEIGILELPNKKRVDFAAGQVPEVKDEVVRQLIKNAKYWTIGNATVDNAIEGCEFLHCNGEQRKTTLQLTHNLSRALENYGCASDKTDKAWKELERDAHANPATRDILRYLAGHIDDTQHEDYVKSDYEEDTQYGYHNIHTKKENKGKNSINLDDYKNIIEYITNDETFYKSDFEKTDSPIKIKLSSYLKLKEEITNEIYDQLKVAKDQLGPPYDNRYKSNLRMRGSCEAALEQILQADNPRQSKETIIHAWLKSDNPILSRATKEALEKRKPESVSTSEQVHKEDGFPSELEQKTTEKVSEEINKEQSQDRKALLKRFKCFNELKDNNDIKEKINLLSGKIARCKEMSTNSKPPQSEKAAAMHSIQEQLRLVVPVGPNARPLVNKTGIETPKITSRRDALDNILKLKMLPLSETEIEINEIIQFLNDKIEEKMKHDKNEDEV